MAMRKSTFCTKHSCCCVGVIAPDQIWYKRAGQNVEVQIAAEADKIKVVNTQHPDGAMVEFTHDEWRDFLAGVCNGDFDLAE